jgi:hypothetical protein
MNMLRVFLHIEHADRDLLKQLDDNGFQYWLSSEIAERPDELTNVIKNLHSQEYDALREKLEGFEFEIVTVVDDVDGELWSGGWDMNLTEGRTTFMMDLPYPPPIAIISLLNAVEDYISQKKNTDQLAEIEMVA